MPKHKPNGYWTKERCAEAALKCKTVSEFKSRFESAYSTTHQKGWRKEICAHMPKHKPNGYWTKERCAEAALKCKTVSEFENMFASAKDATYKNGWRKEICAHMPGRKPSGYWTKWRCAEAALKCKTASEFENRFQGAYSAARKNDWLKEVCWLMLNDYTGFNPNKSGILYYLAVHTRTYGS